MPTEKIHETRSVTRKKALDSLNEMIGMICPVSFHKITIAQLNSKEKFDGFHVRLECGHITWTIQMWEDCRFRKLIRSRRHATALGKFMKEYICKTEWWTDPRTELLGGNNGLTEEGLIADRVWKEAECDVLVQRHRLGKLRGRWWEGRMLPSLSEEEEDDLYVSSFLSFFYSFKCI